MPRLQKLLAAAGIASRRKSEELIRAGRVTVDGETVVVPGRVVDPDRSLICVDGRPLRARRAVYLMLNKPAGVLSSCRDPRGRKTVLDLVGAAGEGLYPVGRLDADSEGLLLLTNDGALTLRLTHPRYQVAKVYLVETEGALSQEALKRLEQGVKLEDGLARADRVRLVRRAASRSLVEIELHTGKKRQIRRMLSALGFRVTRLTRTRMGPVLLGRLPLGRWRRLTEGEVTRLRKAVRLTEDS